MDLLASSDLWKTAASGSVIMGGQPATIENITDIAAGKVKVGLSNDPCFVNRVNSGSAFLETLLSDEGAIYGVTTGYGDSCTVVVPEHLVEELPYHLMRFHGCGLGNYLSPNMGLAVLATRLCSLAQGYSGVRMELLEQLVKLINHRIIPLIPEEGSVGASGDLTPLSYVAAALVGERKAYYQNQIMDISQALHLAEINPIDLKPKEGLAIMNGTAVMTAIACIAFKRAEYLAQLCSRITAMACVALQGNDYHFDAKLFSVKPHPGQTQVADWIRNDLHAEAAPRNSARLQDRYSIRCAPHIIGVLTDSLPWLRQFIENELNSANDNPIIDGEGEHVLHGGHFYGGHIAFAMDSMKTAVANLADLLDRQLALMMDVKFNHGLPPNLSGSNAERAMINHGFKAIQIGASAWTAEALKHTMPASVFSRSTECHNQDKVSMGTIAARDCLRVLQLTEQVAAASLMSVTQGINLRQRQGELEFSQLSRSLLNTKEQIDSVFPMLEEDRPLEDTLRKLTAMIQSQEIELYL